MPSTPSMIGVLALAAVGATTAFNLPHRNALVAKSTALHDKRVVDEDTASPLSKLNIPNPLAEIADLFANFDDAMDDFFNKRMGNGEIFYGKRKYKPSGNIESDYNGGGLSDWRKIEAAREFREERARLREEAQQKAEAEKKRV
ncbi:hypothetical protein ACHAXT_008074 [Thalassiosira profunda]